MAPEKRPSNSTQANMSVDLDELKALQQEGLTVGVVPPDGSLRTRLEIDDFIQDNDLTNLFIISLGLLMNEPWTTDRPFSYFQIASIHGRPYELWNSIGAPRLPKGTPVEKRYNPQSGYASHSSILFPTWNRAYILMFEQALYVRVADLAERYPEPFRSRYRRAARRFAMPYWDPLRPRQKMKNVHGHYFYRTGLPLVCVIPTVMVRTPERPDTLVPVRNPLYQYIFPPTRPGCGEPELAWESLNVSAKCTENRVVC